ncbi:MAG: hypothetical protein JRJ59_01270 [Deltaproteobacteria bacterium]|nr:hypothetical protein [Deltaproteobacteria bacterium]
MMRARRILDWMMRLLFPVVLLGVVVFSIYFQPPLVSSPEVSRQFRDQGSKSGFFLSAATQTSAWPSDLPLILARALQAAFGQDMPRAESFYYVGTARARIKGLPLNFGAEAVLIPGQGLARQRQLNLFGFPVLLFQAGVSQDRAWLRRNGRPREADLEAARTAVWLERAALLLPLAQAGLEWRPAGEGRLKTLIGSGRELILEFKEKRLVQARAGDQSLVLAEPVKFGPYSLASVWTGRWGQAGWRRFQLTGLVLNPPFAGQALADGLGR